MAWDDIMREKDSVSGDKPFDIIWKVLSKIASTAQETLGRRLTLTELMDALAATLKMNYSVLCCDAMGAGVERVIVKLEGHPDLICTGANLRANHPIVAQFYDGFIEMVEVYEQAWERKPRLIELLYALKLGLHTPENYLAQTSGININQISAQLDREVTSYWWKLTGDDVLGYEPGEIIERALLEIAQMCARAFQPRPTPQELAVVIATALNSNLEEFCADGKEVLIQRVDIWLGFDDRPIFSEPSNTANQQLVLKLCDAFISIVKVYQSRWGRLPKLRELLQTLRFALVVESPAEYLSVPDYVTLTNITAELGKKFRWWEIDDENTRSQKAEEIMRTAIESSAKTYQQRHGQYPSLPQLVDAIASTLTMNPEGFCADIKGVSVGIVKVSLEAGAEILSSQILKTADEEMVRSFYTTFEEIVEIYQEKLSRKPRLRELLETIRFGLNELAEDYRVILANSSITEILAELTDEYPIPWELLKHAGIISFEASWKMSQALEVIASTYSEQKGQLPTQQEFLDALAATLKLNLAKFCSDSSEWSCQKVIVGFEDDLTLVSSKEAQTENNLLVTGLGNIFETIASLYLERWNRKPKLKELLDLLRYPLGFVFRYSVLDAEPSKYIDSIIVE